MLTSSSQYNWNIPENILKQVNKLFPSHIISETQSMFRYSKISISFVKEVPGKYYIISGIIKTSGFNETKIVYKERLAKPLSSNCDCHEWNQDHHCPHVVCLFIGHHMNKMQEQGNLIEDRTSLKPPALPPENFGTIIPSPHHLARATGNITYSSLQYQLCNKRIINFPIPCDLKGKLILNIKIKSSFNCSISFTYKKPSLEILKEISLFEHIYLFNWNTGEAFHIPPSLKQFIQKLRIQNKDLDINGLLQICTSEPINKFCETHIGHIPLNKIKRVIPDTKLVFSRRKHTKLLFSELIFQDQKGNNVLPPPFFKYFTFKGGFLSSFKKKSDAYEFICGFSESLDEEKEKYKKNLLTSTKKTQWNELILNLTQNKNTLVYDPKLKILSIYDNIFLRLLLKAFYRNFGSLFFRYAEYLEKKRVLLYQISHNSLFQGLSDFHQKMGIHGLSIFYDNTEVSSWKTNIHFASSNLTKWFSLELNIFGDDLEIIESADIENSLAKTSNGLVLLTKDQKELIKFMKKYTREGENQEEKESDGEKVFTFSLPFNRMRIFELFELKRLGVKGGLPPEDEDLCQRLSTLESIPKYPLPSSMEKFARPYQKTGYHWFRFLYENQLGACLADDMGLGKTLQTIGLIESIYDKVEKILIICPVSLLLNWKNEINKFSQMPAVIYHGGTRTFPENIKIILTSYGVMKREVDETLSKYHFDILILDEVQHLKNIRSLGAMQARKIKAGFRICLTGTPVENNLVEFYNIMDLCAPGIWGDMQDLRFHSKNFSSHMARKTVAPFILRRTKSQVLCDLPPKTENTIFLEMTNNEITSYQNHLIDIRNRVNISPSKRKYGEILKGLLELRLNCLWQESSNIATPLSSTGRLGRIQSTKIVFLLETLEQIIEENHQAIIFSQFTKYLDIIEEAIKERHWRYSRIDGSQNFKKRQGQVDNFQSGLCPIFLISLKAGGFGLNLTAASYIFVMDPWWNPAVESQAIDRAHRIGQNNVLTVYRPIIKNSIEEKVLELQKMKRQLFLDILPEENDQMFTGKLTMKDFEHLFH